MEKKKQKSKGEEKDMNYNSQGNQYGFNSDFESKYMGDYKARQHEGFMMDSMINGVMINPKQMYWICKRKARREFLDRLMVSQENNYMHESRHRHAMKRMRAPSGRFLTKEEISQLENSKDNSQ